MLCMWLPWPLQVDSVVYVAVTGRQCVVYVAAMAVKGR